MLNLEIQTFWKETLSQAAAIPLDAEVIPAPNQSTPWITTYAVRLTSWEGIKIRAWLSVPNLGSKTYPALLTTPGYGGDIEIHTDVVMHGFVLLTLYPRGQGESKKEWQMAAPTQLLHHPLDRNKFYYRGGYVDCLRGIEFLATRPEVDPDRIGIFGISQGGGLTLATCALDALASTRRVKIASAHVPFLCNYLVAIRTATTGPYEHVQKYIKENPATARQYLDTLSYFDPISLADSIACPVLMSAGLKDMTCPEDTIRPVFDAIKTKKSFVVYPDLVHARSLDYRRMEMDWLTRHLTE